MKNFKYDVTVVIPVYNSEQFIDDCVKSLMEQTHDFNKIEIMLINDGSSDNSEPKCLVYAESFPNITYIYKENSGVSDTRNTGIRKASGKYIMLLDSDDYLSKDTIKNLVKFFDKHYDEVDLVTYPIYWDRDGAISLHERYQTKNYDKGTDIYDLDEYPHLNQSTVNIIFKNEYENNLTYDVNMKLSEDQNFDTILLMRKNKIGFVKDAIYYYRRYGGGVSQTRNNPYYCFEDIISYNESLLERFLVNGKIPKYVQTLVVNTLNWRIKADQLLPYHYEKEEFEKAKLRIKNMLKKIDNEVILKHSNCDSYVKMFLLRWKEEKINIEEHEKQYDLIAEDGTLISSEKNITCYVYKVRWVKDKIEMFMSFQSPILEVVDIDSVYVVGKYKNGKSFKQKYSVRKSKVPFRNAKMNTTVSYPFSYEIDPTQIKSFKFIFEINDHKVETLPQYIKYSGFMRKYLRESIPVNNYRLSYHRYSTKEFVITKRTKANDFIQEIKSLPFYPRKKAMAIYAYRSNIKPNKPIWLYTDSPGVIDNSYYQFIHDFDKQDGIERYYVVDGDMTYLEDKLTNKQKERVIKYGTKQHKLLFLNADKIFISFSSFSIYSPFKNLSWYMDLLHYDLVYLQHGLLHASLQKMYGKQYTEIDKFIISSEFEKNNLIENYDYKESDFIMSGMPRMGIKQEQVEVKNKILFAPSWRSYLIGPLKDNRRELKDKEFINSAFFNKINTFLHSNELKELLEKYDLEFEFKLHPIFKDYRHYFDVDQIDRVDINFDKTILEEYKLFITDFSSFQFDFVRLNRPIVYFMPDKKEFDAGLHSYRELDLKYEDAFGKLCLDSQDLLDELKKIVENEFNVEEPYATRMKNFFTIAEDPCEMIYQSLIGE